MGDIGLYQGCLLTHKALMRGVSSKDISTKLQKLQNCRRPVPALVPGAGQMQIAHGLVCFGSAHSTCLLFPENWTFSASQRDLDMFWGSSEGLSFAFSQLENRAMEAHWQ